MSEIFGCSSQPSPQPCFSICKAASRKKGTVDTLPECLTPSGVYCGKAGLARHSFSPLSHGGNAVSTDFVLQDFSHNHPASPYHPLM